MRIVILEVVTAGGFGDVNPSNSNSNFNSNSTAPHATIPHALLQEAVAMVSGLAADCCESLDSFDRDDQSRPISETEFPVGERCVPWILRSLFSAQMSDESPQAHTVEIFWHLGEQNGSSLDRIESNFSPILNSELPRGESSRVDYLTSRVECWDPIREQRLVTAQVFLPGSLRWDLPADDCSQLLTSFATSPLLNRTTLESIIVADRLQLSQQWQEAVQNADAAILIAPQPDMQHWMAALDSLSSKVFAWPLDLLAQAEDKRHLTTVPSLVVQPHLHSWRFFENDLASQSVSPTVSPSVSHDRDRRLADWFASHLSTATTWALKPTDQCGGSDVWKISLAAPIADLDRARWLVQRLRELVTRETSLEQPLLWSPWVAGQPGSLLLLASADGWWCFPPCRQCLSFEDVPVPSELRGLVTQLQTVHYRGSELAPELLTGGLADLLWRQFAGKFTAAQRSFISGWFGLDFVASSAQQATLIEVNPRLTSSYNLLRKLCFADASTDDPEVDVTSNLPQ